MARPPYLPLCTALLLALTLSACQHTYLFAPDRPPKADRQHLVLKPDPRSAARPMDIQSMEAGRVDPGSGQMVYTPMTIEQMEQLYAGESVQGADALRLEVNNSGYIWDNYSLPGAYLGAGLGLVTMALLYSLDSPNGLDAERVGTGVAVVGYLGLHGILWGSLWGILDTQGSTDHRLDP